MNWIDGILIALLLASVIVGSKKGLIRELMAFLIFCVAIVISVSYIDNFAVWIYQQLGGSPLISAFLSFILLLAISYAVFKLLGILFYKIATIKEQKRRDQMGGALIGFLRGWVAIGFLTMLVFLLPMPENFYVSFGNSFFGPTVAKTVPLLYEATASVQPHSSTFMDKIETTLLQSPAGNQQGSMDNDRAEVFRVIYQMDRFFRLSDSGT